MPEHKIILPSKPRVVLEEENKGIYEIDSFYPGYGHTLGNSLRRIIRSSIPGASITSFKIKGVNHEFSTISGIKEDVIIILLNLKKVRFKLNSNEPQVVTLSVNGPKVVTASMIQNPGQVEVLNGDLYIAEITDKNTNLEIEMTVEMGLGFVSKESLQKNKKVEVGTIVFDADFTPIRRVSYEVEDMRVGDKTNFNRLRMSIETDGSITPRDAFSESIKILIHQLSAIIDFKEEIKIEEQKENEEVVVADAEENEEDYADIMKTRIDSLSFSNRTINALTSANIRTIGGIARKKEEDLLEIDGIGSKGIQEIKKILNSFNISLK